MLLWGKKYKKTHENINKYKFNVKTKQNKGGCDS